MMGQMAIYISRLIFSLINLLERFLYSNFGILGKILLNSPLVQYHSRAKTVPKLAQPIVVGMGICGMCMDQYNGQSS